MAGSRSSLAPPGMSPSWNTWRYRLRAASCISSAARHTRERPQEGQAQSAQGPGAHRELGEVNSWGFSPPRHPLRWDVDLRTPSRVPSFACLQPTPVQQGTAGEIRFLPWSAPDPHSHRTPRCRKQPLPLACWPRRASPVLLIVQQGTERSRKEDMRTA